MDVLHPFRSPDGVEVISVVDGVVTVFSDRWRESGFSIKAIHSDSRYR